jgi:hypothetical protein
MLLKKFQRHGRTLNIVIFLLEGNHASNYSIEPSYSKRRHQKGLAEKVAKLA